MTGISQEGVREARAKCESNGRPLAHDASFVLDFARYCMVGINAWRVRRARLVLILLDIMEGISQGVSARERRVNSRPLAHDMPFARATYLPLLDEKRKQNERRRRSFSRLWECNEKIHWDDGSGVHNKTLFRASPFSLVCCMKLIFIFFFVFPLSSLRRSVYNQVLQRQIAFHALSKPGSFYYIVCLAVFKSFSPLWGTNFPYKS